MDNNSRLPFAFLEEVHPRFHGEGPPMEEDLIDFETEYVDEMPKHHHHHGKKKNWLKNWKEMPIDRFPPQPMHRAYDFGVMTGPPVADRDFYNYASSDMQPKDSAMPALALGTRKSRHYKRHYWRDAPHWRHEGFTGENGSTNDVKTGTIYSFLGHVALALGLIVCFAMLTNRRKQFTG